MRRRGWNGDPDSNWLPEDAETAEDREEREAAAESEAESRADQAKEDAYEAAMYGQAEQTA